MSRKYLLVYFFVIFSLCLFTSSSGRTEDNKVGLLKEHMVYVPAYSHIYSGNKERPFLLTITLSIRNIDTKRKIKINSVDYYATQGELLKRYIDEPILLEPLESIRYVVAQRDESGGSGANFIVKWESEVPVNKPIIEAIMIGTQMQQGVSFTSRGREVIPSK